VGRPGPVHIFGGDVQQPKILVHSSKPPFLSRRDDEAVGWAEPVGAAAVELGRALEDEAEDQVAVVRGHIWNVAARRGSIGMT